MKKFLPLFLSCILTAPLLSGQITVNCYPQSQPYWTGSCNTTTKNQNSLMYAYGQVTGSCTPYGTDCAWAKFDLSAIPSNSIIHSVNVYFYTTVNSGNPYFYIRRLSSDPATAQVATIRAQASSGSFYVQYTGSIPFNQYNSFDLGTIAVGNVQTAISSGWFSIAFYEYENGCYYMQNQGWNETNKPYLQVTYSPYYENDVAIGSLISPAGNFCAGNVPVTFELSNPGANYIWDDTINWSVNGIQQLPYHWSGSIAPGANTNVTPGNFNFTAGNAVIEIHAANPNGQTDPVPSDNIKTFTETVNGPLAITEQPLDNMLQEGGTASFSVTASNVASYQWKRSADGGTGWLNLTNQMPYSGVTSSSMSIQNVSSGINGYMYRCYMTGICGSGITSNEVNLFICPITTVRSVYTCSGDTVVVPVHVRNMFKMSSFTLTLTYDPSVASIEYLNNINSALDTNGSIDASEIPGKLTIIWNGQSPVSMVDDRLLFNLVFNYLGGSCNLQWDTQTGANCTYKNYLGNILTSACINGNIIAEPVITQQPQNVMEETGLPVYFRVGAIGSSSFTWQVSSNAPDYNEWTAVVANSNYYFGANGDTMYIRQIWDNMNYYHYRCVLNGCSSTATSNTALLRVRNPVKTFLGAPSRNGQFINCIQDTVMVPIVVQNFDSIDYLSITLKVLMSSLQYIGFQNVNPALMNTFMCCMNWSGDTAFINVWNYGLQNACLPNNDTMLELKFKYLANSTFLTWDTVSYGGLNCFYTNSNYDLLPSVFYSGSVDQAITSIGTQALSQTVPIGDTATFSVVSTSTGIVSFQWQLSTNGGTTWANIIDGPVYAGALTQVIKVLGATAAMNSNQYHCILTGQCTTLTSMAANLKISFISGILKYDNLAGSPICCSKVYLKSLSGAIIDSALTGQGGAYQFIKSYSGIYKLGVQSSNPCGGINASDALDALKHLTEMITLTGLKFLAGDVNGNGAINSVDALLIAKRYVGLITTFPAGDWVFEEPVVDLSAGTSVSVDIHGLCIGDINASFNSP